MDINGLRKMTLPKLRDLAKQVTDLQGVVGMKKEDLIEAIVKVQGIAYEAPAKDITTISSMKTQIRELKKQREEILASSRDHARLKRIRGRIKKLKRLTRRLAGKAQAKSGPKPGAVPEPQAAAS